MAEFRYSSNNREYTVSIVHLENTTWKATIEDREYVLILDDKQSSRFNVRINERSFLCNVDSKGDDRIVIWRGNSYTLQRIDNQSSSHGHHTAAGEVDRHIRAPMPGKVIKMQCAAGNEVAEKAPVVVLEAMKMEYVLCAPRNGKIEAVLCKQGDQVELGDVLVSLESDEAPASATE